MINATSIHVNLGEAISTNVILSAAPSTNVILSAAKNLKPYQLEKILRYAQNDSAHTCEKAG